MKRRTLAAPALLLLWAGCAQVNVSKTADIATEEKTVRDIEMEWSKAAAAKDVEKVVSYYAEDAALFPPNAPIAIGKPSIRTTWTGLMATPGLALTWAPMKVEVSKTGDMAYDYGTYSMMTSDASGKTINDRGKYVAVWKKQTDGSWKSVADIFNSDLPPAAPAPAQ